MKEPDRAKGDTVPSLQKIGGIAALLQSATFVVGFVLLFTLLASADYGSLDIDPAENVAFLAENEGVMYTWHLIVYVAFGAFLVVLALALYERLKAGSPAIAQTATAFGLIWATLVIATGMVENIGAGVVVDLHEQGSAQAVPV